MRARDVTDKKVYVGRRRLLAGAAAAGTLAGAGIFFDRLLRVRTKTAHGARIDGVTKSPLSTTEPPTPYAHVTTYNNFYELETDKYAPSRLGGTLRTRPWTVSFEGEIARPQVLDVDTLIRRFPLEERIYRFRCVEGWSMVIPWVGFPLGDLVRSLAPTSRARFVEFTTLLDPEQLPGQRRPVLAWPYVEGLRIDEAVHPLTLLAVGLYGEVLPAQNGAPIRLVVPWKYGFKGAKSIVRIRFTETQPETTWVKASPTIYGFQSNVNPAVSPAWSQADEFRLGEVTRRPTLLFNGYEGQVGSMYAGMDLTREI